MCVTCGADLAYWPFAHIGGQAALSQTLLILGFCCQKSKNDTRASAMSWRYNACRSSVPGGVFGASPEPQQRERLDGRAGGRGNSSSLPGGIFGSDTSQPRALAHTTKTYEPSVQGGIFGGGVWCDDSLGRPISHSQPLAVNGPAHGGSDDFLDRLGEAEERDDEHAAYLQQLQDEEEAAYLQQLQDELAANRHLVAAAAAQLAQEQGLTGEEQLMLEQQMMLRLEEQQEQNRQERQQRLAAQQQQQRWLHEQERLSQPRPTKGILKNAPSAAGSFSSPGVSPPFSLTDGSQPQQADEYENPFFGGRGGRARGEYNHQPPLGGMPAHDRQVDGPQAAGGRSTNAHHLMGWSAGHRDPNASSIPGGIFG